ncbi:uncharacterized protein LOC114541433 [Dendronephthya gigantea]|uniref:uncharacterized protein LOC114541433 n=1 Tax=Dendronephthya gigantea TaxID=151771 RepID=UPI00106CA26C|nr:uncharacterized protein LOC114541433 [Dendronephthya gigantea]
MCSSSQQGNAKLALGLSKLYEREFNQPDLHDKVLVFDVVASNKHDLSKENVRENKSNMNEIIENEEGENQWERASRNGKVNNEGINTDDENETKVYNCEMSSKYANGGQRVEKRLNNLGEDEHVGTETNAIKDTLIDEDKMKCVEVNEAEETAAASKHEITVNENVRVSPHANNRNKLKDQPESEISNDDNDPNLHLSDGETSEKLLNHIENAITYADDLVITLQSFLEKEFSPLDETWPTKSFEDLSETLLRYLLNSDKLVVISENTVFHALMHWIEKRGIEKLSESRELPSLLSVVRNNTTTVVASTSDKKRKFMVLYSLHMEYTGGSVGFVGGKQQIIQIR